MITTDILKKIPKVELHYHLDGGLRAQTIIDLATAQGVDLPCTDPGELRLWFHRGADRKNLALYLEGFALTCAVMQDEASLERVAFEAMEDLAGDGVVYAEIRYAPILMTEKGLSMESVVRATLLGLAKGTKKTGTGFGLILCAMRNQSPELSLKIAELAVNFRDKGVVGFDIAGDEHGHPPKHHLKAFQHIRNENFNITLHAGEAFGIESIWQAIQVCGAHRIGHGTRLGEDISNINTSDMRVGSLAHFVRDKRIPMEICLSSNIHTGAAETLDKHPFDYYYRNSFRVALCTDNTLMSDTSLSKEMGLAVKHYGLTIKDLEKLTINAMKSAFLHYDDRLRVIYDVIKSGYAEVRNSLGMS